MSRALTAPAAGQPGPAAGAAAPTRRAARGGGRHGAAGAEFGPVLSGAAAAARGGRGRGGLPHDPAGAELQLRSCQAPGAGGPGDAEDGAAQRRPAGGLGRHQGPAQIDAARAGEPAQPRAFFLDGPGGTGKTFLYDVALAYVRGLGEIAVAVAASGAAALLLEGGSTAHSRLKIPINLHENSTCACAPLCTWVPAARLIGAGR